MRVVTKLIIDAYQKDFDNRAWDQWIALYRDMIVPCSFTNNQEPILRHVSFDEFKEKLRTPVSMKSKDEIYDEVAEIRRVHARMKGGE